MSFKDRTEESIIYSKTNDLCVSASDDYNKQFGEEQIVGDKEIHISSATEQEKKGEIS